MLKTTDVLSFALLCFALDGCAPASVPAESPPAPPLFGTADRASMAHGADISWLGWLESKGVAWADASGAAADPVELLKGLGVDAVRLRVMVDPDPATGVGFVDQASVVALAERCRDAGISR